MFVAPGFMEAFPVDFVLKAFGRLSTQDQALMLVRVYAPTAQGKASDYMDVIKTFAENKDIDVAVRELCLQRIRMSRGQHADCIAFVKDLLPLPF